MSKTIDEWNKERQSKMSPTEKLADEVGTGLLLGSIRRSVEDQVYSAEWLRRHSFADYATPSEEWQQWSRKIAMDLGHALPHYLLAEGDIAALERLAASLPKDPLADEPKRLPKPIEFTSEWYMHCHVCGEPFQASFDGIDFTILNECRFPHGLIVEVDVPFPSGRVVVENDVSGLFPEVEDKDPPTTPRDLFPESKQTHPVSVNALMGCALVGVDYAKAGCAHLFVGNCCPGVYRYKRDRLVVGAPKGRRKTMDVDGCRYRSVAGICTDLWWYSMTDYDEWVRRAECEPNGPAAEVIEVEPGLYRFTHRRHSRRAGEEYEDYGVERQETHTTIKRVGVVGEIEPLYRVIPAKKNQ